MSLTLTWPLVALPLAAAGAVALWRWLRRGAYRRADDAPVLDLRRSWLVLPAAAVAATAVTVGPLEGPLLVGGLAYVVAGAGLAWIDLDVHRVPDQVLRWVAPAAVAAVCGAAVLERSWTPLVGAGAGAAGLGASYLVLALVGSMGLGDVKLAAVTGLVLGPVGVGALLVATAAGFVLAGVLAAVLVATRRAHRGTHLPFAPAIVLGAVVAMA